MINKAQMELKRQAWTFLFMLSVAEGVFAEAVINGIQNTSSHLIPCEDGWYPFGDKCYKAFISKSEAWKAASDSCAVYNATLVTIQSQELQDFLTLFLLLDVKTNVWIGLNDLKEESMYAWSDGSIANYTYWDYKEPSDAGISGYLAEDCVEMQYSTRIGRWNDVSCYDKQPFICQKDKSEQAMTHDPRLCSGENDGDWKYQNSCYHTVREEMSWDDAENYCQTIFNGHLLAITDANVDLFLSNYVLSDFRREFWIGVKIRDASQQMWTSSWIVTFNRWESSEITKMNGTCAHMTENRLWSSAPCFDKLPFVCEVPHVKPPPLKQAPEGWGCPELSQDWVELGGDTCYIFETSSKQWFEANFACMKKGGRLASISSVAEANAIHRRLKGGPKIMLIGLHRSLSGSSVFEWADGTVSDYENWKFGEPSSRYQDCGALRTDDMKWIGISRSTYKGYICSAKKVPILNQEKNESASIDSQIPVQTICSVPATNTIVSTSICSQFPADTDCSEIAGLLGAVVILFVLGCTIDLYRNH